MPSTYDPAAVTLSFANIEVNGYADGAFLSLTRAEDSYETIKGVDAHFLRIKKGDTLWTVEAVLLQSSPANAQLTAIHQLDLDTNNGAGIGILGMADTSGTSIFGTSEAWIRGWPEDWTYDKTATNRTWKFDCIKPFKVIGGN